MCCHDFVLVDEMVHVQMVRSISRERIIARTAKLVAFLECNNFITKMVDSCNHFCNKTRNVIILLQKWLTVVTIFVIKREM